MAQNSSPKYLKEILNSVEDKIKLTKRTSSEILERQQIYYDEVLEIYQEAFEKLIDNTVTYTHILTEIKISYENALHIRDKRIAQFITQDMATDEVPKIFVLDGGFSSQLSRHVGTTFDGDPLWSARFLQTHPEEVMNTHLDFLRAGADIIMTNTYQASVGGFVKYLNVTPEEGLNLIRRAVDLAKQARCTYLEERKQTVSPEHTPLIVGSVGPYGAHLHDGSEYSGQYADNTPTETISEWHAPRIKALIEAGVDMLAFETIPCQVEAEVLLKMLKDYPNTKAWVSFSCKDDKSLAHGENFQMVARNCWDLNPNQLVAVGVNCCSPLIVSSLFKGINEERKDNPIPLVTYPNSGEKYNEQLGWFDREKCIALENFIYEWLDLGVRYVGGCCRTYSADITGIRTRVQSWYKNKL